ncbi:EAL domain-containing protein [Clostridiales bacterium AHG0011]|nr:EAL domain-containing protein [Clostridiales bacterium AHG0011]RGC57073.1 EAL domain-containing protein [Dorea longicatena]
MTDIPITGPGAAPHLPSEKSPLPHLEKIKSKAYKIALNNYVGGAQESRLTTVDILKVDFMQTTPRGRQDIADCHRGCLTLLTEKIETIKRYDSVQELGHTFFQGYYFSRPVPFSNRQPR